MKSFLISVTILGLLSAAPVFAQNSQAGHVGQTKASGITATNAQRIQIAVTRDGFVPASTKVKVGQPVTLLITRKVERTCATDIVIKEYGISKRLPMSETVEVTLTPTKAGKIRFACAMDMIAGELIAE